MEEKKRGRPAGKKLSADFYKKSAPQREDLALIAQGKIKLGADMDTPVKPEYDSKKDKPEYDGKKEKPAYDGNLVGIGPNMTGRDKPGMTRPAERRN